MCNDREKMQWLHFLECASTQKILLEKWSEDAPLAVTCDRQLAGIGRADHSWEHVSGGLAFSFMLAPLDPATLSSLEIGLNLVRFFSQHQVPLTLKWPNDLFNSRGQKCGGILIHQLSEKWLAVGIGLNLYGVSGTQYDHYQRGNIFEHCPPMMEKLSPRAIIEYLISHRVSPAEVLQQWPKSCFHRGMPVKIESGKQTWCGKFIGIGKLGEALLLVEEREVAVYSGSLSILPTQSAP